MYKKIAHKVYVHVTVIITTKYTLQWKGHKNYELQTYTINERCCIANFLDLGWSIRKIAKHLNRNASTISREIRRNSVNGKYLAHIANEIYLNNRMNCGSKGKSSNCKLIEYIENGLNKTWSLNK